MRLPQRAREERGVAMIVVLAFMVLAIPATTAALSFTATVSQDSREQRARATEQFSAVGANDYAIFRLLHEPGFKEGLVPGVPVQEILPLNGGDVAVTWEKRGSPGATLPPNPPAVLSTSKGATPATIPADTPTTVTYTIQVTNDGPDPADLLQIHDGLPPHAVYLTGTTTGVTTSDPSVFAFDDGQGGAVFQFLTWDLTTQLQPAEFATLQFQVQMDAPEGHYCNEAWADPGGKATGTGPTAKLQVGAPVEPLCVNELVEVRKTVDTSSAPSGTPTVFRYRIEVENASASSQSFTWIYDVLPAGFTYQSGSVSGDITTSNPFAWFSGGQQRLFWLFFFGKSLDPAQTKFLEFDASATLSSGSYTNQAWVGFNGLLNSAYTYPTAEVTVFDVFDVTVSDGETTSTAQVWVGDDGFEVTEWELVQS